MSVSKPSEIIGSYSPSTFKIENKLGRYNVYRRLINKDGKEYIETPDKLYIEETRDDSFYSVESGYVNRLDLVSYRFYGTPLLWWAIAVVNHIDNPMDVKAGIVLRIPTLKSIYNSGGLLTDG